MSKNIVADFSAFLSVSVDDEPLFETREGRVVMTRENLAVAGEDTNRKFPLDALVEFDFRTVPPQWEQFFDDLVGVRFQTADEESIVTIGTETAVADRFVTVLLKLLLDETGATVRQRRYPIEGEGRSHSEDTSFTLYPKREEIAFENNDLAAIDISTITDVQRCGEAGESVLVHHLDESGRISTEITPESDRGPKFLRTYLEFRREIADSAGPVQFLFVGEDRDTLVLIAKVLKHRNLPFEASHATSGEEALEALDSTDVVTECIVSEYELTDTTAEAFGAEIRDRDHDAPVVYVAEEDPANPDVVSEPGVVDVITISSRTQHYEDVADALERAVLAARLDTDPGTA
jgi:hypothetical protein